MVPEPWHTRSISTQPGPDMKRLVPLAVAAVALLSGCGLFGLGKGKAPPPIRIELVASTRLNPDDQGNALPTLVRVYQLSSAARARGAELTDLLRDPKVVLGEDLLSVDEVLLTPGEKTEKVVARDKEARAVLVAAVVRRPAAAGWRDVVELPAGKSPRLSYLVEEYRITRR
jgi:type VI secretion system protein VasD